MRKVIGIIPARYDSSRFPGKPLADINGESMIKRVYDQCLKAEKLNKIIVATDDDRIYKHVLEFGGNVMMTAKFHQSGTERCGEVVEKLEDKGEFYDVVVNIQGDEPFISPLYIDEICQIILKDKNAEIGTLAKQITKQEDLFDKNVVKVVMTEDYKDKEPRDALYFSRNPIPFVREFKEENWLSEMDFYKHLGIYAFSIEAFYEIQEIENSKLESAEKLECLRWLSHHFTIQISEVEQDVLGIDTPEDLKKIILQ